MKKTTQNKHIHIFNLSISTENRSYLFLDNTD